MSKPPATWRSGWTRFLLCEMRRCKHATVFRFCRASLTALRAPMFESRRDSSVQPEVGCVAAYLGSTFKSSTTPTRVASIFRSAAVCKRTSRSTLVDRMPPKPTTAAAGLADTAALRRKARTQLFQSCYSCSHFNRVKKRRPVSSRPNSLRVFGGFHSGVALICGYEPR